MRIKSLFIKILHLDLDKLFIIRTVSLLKKNNKSQIKYKNIIYIKVKNQEFFSKNQWNNWVSSALFQGLYFIE